MKSLIFIILLTLTSAAYGQLMYNGGQVVHSDLNAIVYVQGSLKNDQLGSFDHQGYIRVDSSYINNSGTTKGNGVYDVYVDWVNNAVFIRDTSHVYLKGGNQLITGDSVTAFYNLTCSGSGVKRMTINSEVFRYLNLNALELAADQDTIFIMNPDTNAIRYVNTFGGEGFISNLDTGAVVRLTNSTGKYIYPMGSSIGPARYREIDITPNNAGNDEYSVSFMNHNPFNNGFDPNNVDTSLCVVNDKFYHKVGRLSGSDAADFAINYLSSDGSFDAIGNFKNSLTEWHNIHNPYVSSTGNYLTLTRQAWSNFNDLPYSLGTEKQSPVMLSSDSIICGSTDTVYFTAPVYANNTYNWNVSPGQIVVNNGNHIGVVYTSPGAQVVTLNLTNTLTNCVSNNTVPYTLLVGSGPTANFGLASNPALVNNIVTIADSSINAVQWWWDLGNGQNSTQQNPQAVYNELGTYTVTLIAYDTLGCMDTLVKEIFIDGNFIIPNIFTPNGDGVNDVYTIKNLGLHDLSIQILNRWGDLVYEGTEGTSAWDGNTPSGQACAEGTYFYIIEGTTGGKKKTYNGYLQLSR